MDYGPVALSPMRGRGARVRTAAKPPRILALAAAVAVALVLGGCAAHQTYEEGRRLIAQDRAEEGLLKLQQAVVAAPGNPEYRAVFLHTRNRLAAALVLQGDQAATAGRPEQAELLYRRALDIDGANESARTALLTLARRQRHGQILLQAQGALDRRDTASARALITGLLAEDPSHAAAGAMMRALAERQPRTPETPVAAGIRKPINIEFKEAQLKQVFEVLSMGSGLNFVLDKDVKTDQKTTIFLKDSTVEAALRMLLLTNQLEQQVLDANTILIYPNTAAKQKDYQELVIRSFFLTNADAKTVGATVKTILKTRDVVVDEKLNMVIVRDTPEVVKLAEKLVALHDTPESEVMLEVEILEVKQARLRELGIEWPSALSLTALPTLSVPTLRDFRDNLSSATIGVGLGPIVARARKDDSDTKLLANPRIRARNREKARIVIGERVPIISTTTVLSGSAPVSSEAITYVDVGLKLEVEPTIYLDNDVAIRVALEVSNLGSEVPTKSGSVAYRIGTRTATTVLRLRDGENQVLAGLINDEDRRSANKVPGLGELPVLARLFGSSFDNSDKTEIVLSITPRIIRNIQRPTGAQAEFRSGTDLNFRSAADAGPQEAAAVAPGAGASAGPAGPAPAVAPSEARAAPAALPGGTPQPAPGSLPLIAPPTPPAAPSTGPAAPPAGSSSSSAPARGAAAAPAQVAAADAAPPPISGAATPAVGAGGGAADARVSATLLSGPVQLKVGDPVAVDLVMESSQGIGSVQLTLGVDEQALQVVGVTESDFLRQGGAPTSFSSQVAAGGQVTIRAARVTPVGAGARGPAAVATLRLRAIAPSDAARVQLLQVDARDTAGRPVPMPTAAPHTLRIGR